MSGAQPLGREVAARVDPADFLVGFEVRGADFGLREEGLRERDEIRREIGVCWEERMEGELDGCRSHGALMYLIPDQWSQEEKGKVNWCE